MAARRREHTAAAMRGAEWVGDSPGGGKDLMTPLTVWGDPTVRTSFTIDLYPVFDRLTRQPERQVLVYAADLPTALAVARQEGLPLLLEPRVEERRPD